MKRSSIRVLAPLLAVGVLACSGAKDADRAGVGVIEDPPAGSRLVPFPSDHYTVDDSETGTGMRVQVSPVPADDPALSLGEVIPALGCLDGFGTYGPAVIAFTGAIDTGLLPEDGNASVAPGSPVRLVDVDPGSPQQGQAMPFHWVWVEDGYLLVLQPLRPLARAQRYAVMLTTALRSVQGEPLAPSSVVKRLRTEGLYSAGLTRLAERLPAALAVLESHGVVSGAGELLALTVFTTQDFAATPLAVTAAIRNQAGVTPPAPVAGSVTIEPSADPRLAAQVEGRFDSGDYRGPDGSVCYTPGELAAGAEPRGWQELDFSLWLPAGGPGPFPVVIFLHGMSGSRQEGRGAALHLAEIGLATVAIDAPEHGSRHDGGVPALDFLGLDLGTLTIDPRRPQGNFSQTTYDHVQLLMLVQNRFGNLDVLPQGAPDGVADIAPSPVFFFGSSLGGTAGPMFIALAPEIEAAVLIVPGGGFLHFFLDGPLYEAFGENLIPSGGTLADLWRFMAIGQAVMDAADPVNYAPALVRAPFGELPGAGPVHVLVQEVMEDATIPNPATEALVRAMGIPVLPPVLLATDGVDTGPTLPCSGNIDGITAGLFQFDAILGEAGLEEATHSKLAFNEVGVAQWRRFLETALFGTPEIVDPFVVLGLR